MKIDVLKFCLCFLKKFDEIKSLLLLIHFYFTITIFILQTQYFMNLVGFCFLNQVRLSFNQDGIFMNGIQIYLFVLIIKYLVDF